MRKQDGMFVLRLLIGLVILITLLAGCTQSSGPCPVLPYADLSGAASFTEDDRLTFQFPLDDAAPDASPLYTYFCRGQLYRSGRKYHAAEDFFRPGGTPVYAMADGTVSFSGPMGGYGWLIIIDHPRANLYSLYGHLSPSRWRMDSGTVEKGELIAYLGDSFENGGSPKNPLEPHLHLGVRAGRRADYPGRGEWRWQAGWIKPCPVDLGWLQPSAIITGQSIPAGGFPEPAAGFVARWGNELLFAGLYLFFGACMLVVAIKRDKPFVLAPTVGMLLAVGWIFRSKGTAMSYALFAGAVLYSAIGAFHMIRRSKNKSRTEP